MLMQVWQKWMDILTRFIFLCLIIINPITATPIIPIIMMKNPAIEIVTPVESGT